MTEKESPPHGEHCGALLERVVFPFMGLTRKTGEDDLPLAISEGELNVETGGRVGVIEQEEGQGTKVIVELKITARVTELEGGEDFVTAGMTAHGHFRCDAALSADDVRSYLDSNHDAVVQHWTFQIYALVVHEFERMVSLAGLPPMEIPLSPPKISSELNARNERKTSSPATKKTAPSRRISKAKNSP